MWDEEIPSLSDGALLKSGQSLGGEGESERCELRIEERGIKEEGRGKRKLSVPKCTQNISKKLVMFNCSPLRGHTPNRKTTNITEKKEKVKPRKRSSETEEHKACQNWKVEPVVTKNDAQNITSVLGIKFPYAVLKRTYKNVICNSNLYLLEFSNSKEECHLQWCISLRVISKFPIIFQNFSVSEEEYDAYL